MTAHNTKWHYISNIFLATVFIVPGIAFFIAIGYALDFGILDVNWLIPLSVISILMAIVSFYTIITKKQMYIILSLFMVLFLSIILIKAVPVAIQMTSSLSMISTIQA
jgi:hypothetical protein